MSDRFPLHPHRVLDNTRGDESAHLAFEEGHPPTETAIIALGNPLRGDDGVGLAVLETLRNTMPAPSNVTLLDCSRGGLLNALLSQGYRRVIIVDAADMGRVPGEWACFGADEAILTSKGEVPCGTLHHSGLAEALELGKALGLAPPKVEIYGVQPLSMSWARGLSTVVQTAIIEICASILEKLNVTGQDGSEQQL